MITLTVAQLQGLLAAYGWPFVRIIAFIATEPVLGNRAIPRQVKIALALLITVVVAPVLPPPPDVPPASAAGLLVLAQQVLIGAAMGFASRIVIAAAEMIMSSSPVCFSLPMQTLRSLLRLTLELPPLPLLSN